MVYRQPSHQQEALRYSNNIRRYRHRLYVYSWELAKAVGVNPPALCRWEHSRSEPTLTNALALSAALECPVEVLFLPQFQDIRVAVRARVTQLPSRPYPDERQDLWAWPRIAKHNWRRDRPV